MKKNVLVIPCGSEIGLEVYRSLAYSIHVNLFGASSVDDHGKYVYQNYIDSLPYVDEDNFLSAINHIVQENNIDFIIPAHDSVVLKLAEARKSGELKCGLITSPLQTCAIARSKSKTYEALRNVLPVPKIFNLSQITEADLPIFLKPDVGQGSKGTFLAKTLKDIEYHSDKDLLYLEYLPGKEYTVDCFTDRKRQLRYCEGRIRNRVQNGISVNSSTVDDERFRRIGETINQTLDIRGAWFFQVKENDSGDLVLLEIAPRIAGTMALARAKGVNLALLSLFDAMDLDVEVRANHYSITIDRALDNTYQHDINYKNVYLDFDDTVILDGKVNPNVMAFVFQCLNKDVKVYLITRHREDLEMSLKKYHLEGLFTELIWLENGEAKADHIHGSEAIFIDDSFAERQAVEDKLGIPTFDAHMIEALREKF